VKILLVETEPADVPGLEDTSAHISPEQIEMERVPDLSGTLARLLKGGIDLVLLDLDLPDSHGFNTFERVLAAAPDLPIVVLTQLEDEELALSTVRGGAQDYLIKGKVSSDLLRRSIQYALERHRLTSALRSLSLIDDLTGLYNRRGFIDLGEQHLKLARRTARPVILVFLDVDRLKAINDTWGHHMGDKALVGIAEILRDTFRQSDILARMGGDEFAVMVLETTEGNQLEFIHRLRDKVDQTNERTPEPYQLSVSLGTAMFEGGDGRSLADLLHEADRAMYEEKRKK
jgi:diguanylate cyclase (GGDEF)-like protein